MLLSNLPGPILFENSTLISPVSPGLTGLSDHSTFVQEHDTVTFWTTIGMFVLFLNLKVQVCGPLSSEISPKSCTVLSNVRFLTEMTAWLCAVASLGGAMGDEEAAHTIISAVSLDVKMLFCLIFVFSVVFAAFQPARGEASDGRVPCGDSPFRVKVSEFSPNTLLKPKLS